MRARMLTVLVAALGLVTSATSIGSVGAGAAEGGGSGGPVTRPVAELFGQHLGYGFVGEGVNTATGNFTTNVVDLPMSTGVLDWGRTSG